MKYVKDDFVTDVEADIQLLKNLRVQWFGKDNMVKSDPKLIRLLTLFANR